MSSLSFFYNDFYAGTDATKLRKFAQQRSDIEQDEDGETFSLREDKEDDLILGSYAIEVDEIDLESASEPTSLSVATSFYETFILCGDTSSPSTFSPDKTQICQWILRLLRRAILALIIIPIPLYIDLVRRAICMLDRPLLSEEVEDVLQKLIGLRVSEGLKQDSCQ